MESQDQEPDLRSRIRRAWMKIAVVGAVFGGVYGTEASGNRLRPTSEIEAVWTKDSASIQQRWANLLP
jgi:hypothetical protein